MKNFPIIDKETGREYWISRSVAVVVFFIAYDENGLKHILAVQRGSGTPDPEFVGSWCLPCGYLDFDETLQQAASRELFEETGIKTNSNQFKLLYFNDDPKSDKRQNITFRYLHTSTTPLSLLKGLITTENCESNEVSNIEFIPINKVFEYKWAFNHDKLIRNYENFK